MWPSTSAADLLLTPDRTNCIHSPQLWKSSRTYRTVYQTKSNFPMLVMMITVMRDDDAIVQEPRECLCGCHVARLSADPEPPQDVLGYLAPQVLRIVILCMSQRFRAQRGKHTSTARFTASVLPLATKRRSSRPCLRIL